MAKGDSIVISLMVAIMVDMTVVMMCNDVVDMVVYFGVIFIVAGLCGSSCNFNYLWQLPFRMTFKDKVAVQY